jgi:hypothetical protein
MFTQVELSIIIYYHRSIIVSVSNKVSGLNPEVDSGANDCERERSHRFEVEGGEVTLEASTSASACRSRGAVILMQIRRRPDENERLQGDTFAHIA